jgi:hypothetical protein
MFAETSTRVKSLTIAGRMESADSAMIACTFSGDRLMIVHIKDFVGQCCGALQQDRDHGSMASRSFEIAQMRNIGLGTFPCQLRQTILVYGSSQVRRQFNFANDLQAINQRQHIARIWSAYWF